MANFYGATTPNYKEKSVWYNQPFTYLDEGGINEYQKALSDWNTSYKTYSDLLNEVSPTLKEAVNYYSPGGGYGQGQKQEAQESVQAGVNKDLGQMVSTGMSSQAGAKGLQTLAGSELSKLYKNIEDTRAQLLSQSITPYAQLSESIAQMSASRPSYKDYVTELQSYGWF